MKKQRQRRAKVVWPVPARQPELEKDGSRPMRAGEPYTIDLVRDEGDQALRGYHWSNCCDCGLRHFEGIEVFRDKDGEWWMTRRSYRDQRYMDLAKGKRRKR